MKVCKHCGQPIAEVRVFCGHRCRASYYARSSGNERRQAILAYIIAYKRANDGLSPTIREIAKEVGLTTNPVHKHLKKLEEAGHIVNLGYRGIKVVGGCWRYEGEG